MESLLVTPIRSITETQLDEQIGLRPLPFANMNKSGAGVCKFFPHEHCQMGNHCPYRHLRPDRTIVCKHWLRGLCKKGDDCEFLHEYDLMRMPECYFFTRFGVCMNKECNFLHVDPESKIQDCLWYDRGFCRNGPLCKNRHVRRKLCTNFMNGFCPKGKTCDMAHPKFWPLPIGYIPQAYTDEMTMGQKKVFHCHHCGERGHKIQYCLKLTQEERHKIVQQMGQIKPEPDGTNPYSSGMPNATTPHSRNHHHQNQQLQQPIYNRQIGPVFLNQYDISKHLSKGGQPNTTNNPETPAAHPPPRSLDEVTCFKCGEKGHYANRCNKGYLAFLSRGNQQQLKQ